jgi:hypothetical protein
MGGRGEVPAPMIMTLIPVFGLSLLVVCEAMLETLYTRGNAYCRSECFATLAVKLFVFM